MYSFNLLASSTDMGHCRDTPLSAQNGDMEELRWSKETFDAMLPGTPKVLTNPDDVFVGWRELNLFICKKVYEDSNPEKVAPQFEYINTGERVRVVRFDNARVEVTMKQWNLMSEHLV